MLQRQAQRFLLQASTFRGVSCCAVESGRDIASTATAPPQPGTVTPYDQHILLQLPAPPGAVAAAPPPGSRWPQLIEREPAVIKTFTAVAKQDKESAGKVKITAFEAVVPGRYGGGPPPGTCNLLAFPSALRFDSLSMEQVGPAVALAIADSPSQLKLKTAERKALDARRVPLHDLYLLVCCHAARDARCGQLGPPLAVALQRLVRSRSLEEKIAVYATSHVGGHKYAGNVVVYGAVHPCDGDWFGGVSASNAEVFLDGLLGVELGVDGGAEDPALRPFWRGRMGLSREEQRELWEQGGAIEEVGLFDHDGGGEDEMDDELEQLVAERRKGYPQL